MKECEIPFIGGDALPASTSPQELGSFIKEEDKIPLLLAISLYETPRTDFTDFIYQEQYRNPRFGVWVNEALSMTVVGLRGTSPTASKGSMDLQDDRIIADAGSPYCDISIVQQVRRIIEEFKSDFIVFVGHSLGGTAAFCLTNQYPNSRGIAFNPGAAPTNPVLSGPGQRMTVYHIVGKNFFFI